MTEYTDPQPPLPTDQEADTKHPPGNNRGMLQAYQLRDFTAETALSLKDLPLAERETASQRAQALASLVKAWDYASDRLRIMRNRPLPGSLRPDKPPTKRSRSTLAIRPVLPTVQSTTPPANGSTEYGGDCKGETGDGVKLNRP